MATWTPKNKNSSSFTSISKALQGAVNATSGLYYGFGAFTYSGGEVLVEGALNTFTNKTKNSSTFTNLNKN